MGILQRHVARELLLAFLAVTGALLAILFVYQAGSVLARAAEQQYPSGVVLRLFLYAFTQNATLLIPFGVLLAVVLAFGRLYQDNEMVAAQACGLGRPRLLAAVAALAVPAALLAAWLALSVAPRVAQRESALRAEALRTAMSVPIAAGQFRSLSGGRVVVFAREALPDGELREVFIRRGMGERAETIVARSARTQLTADGLSQTITLRDGERIEGVPGSASQRIMRFAEQSIPIQLPPSIAVGRRIYETPSAQLWRSAAGADRAELHTRLGWPLMTLVLAACAVSISRLRPRQGRFARVWLAVVLFAVYAAASQVAAVWLDKGVVPTAAGGWWVHGLFALLALWLARPPRPPRTSAA